MAGFRKAKAEQAALKVGMYGPPGKGKTLSALLLAEGLAKIANKRIAYVDTERGTDFYCKPVPQRSVHPAAFDFDAIYTRSLTEVISNVKALDAEQHGIVVIDSITHLWEAAQLAYEGRRTRVGTIPLSAWGEIKRPYKDLIRYLLSAPFHVIICGRQGNEFGEDEESGEMKKLGVKMKAEGETAYEPHILIRMESTRDNSGIEHIFAIPEKDRSGVLAGRRIELWPTPTDYRGDNYTFDILAKPLLPLLGHTQANLESDDDISNRDAEAIADQEQARAAFSEQQLRRIMAKMQLCENLTTLKAVSKEITSELKKKMLPAHVTELRAKYQEFERAMNNALVAQEVGQ